MNLAAAIPLRTCRVPRCFAQKPQDTAQPAAVGRRGSQQSRPWRAEGPGRRPIWSPRSSFALLGPELWAMRETSSQTWKESKRICLVRPAGGRTQKWVASGCSRLPGGHTLAPVRLENKGLIREGVVIPEVPGGGRRGRRWGAGWRCPPTHTPGARSPWSTGA